LGFSNKIHKAVLVIKTYAYGQNWFNTVYNCKHFELIWVDYKQPPRYFWCRADHCHPTCPEKEINVASIPKYSIC